MRTKYISQVNAQRYKNLDLEKGLKLSEGLNIFIGSNDSGKSNFIALLKFLKDSISDNTSSKKNGATDFIKALADLGESRMLNVGCLPPEKVNLTYSFFVENIINNELNLHLSILCLDKKYPQIVEEYLSEFSEHHDEPFYFYRFSHHQSSGYGAIFDTEDISRYTAVNEIPNDEIGLSIIPKLLEQVEVIPEAKIIYHVRRQIINGSILVWH